MARAHWTVRSNYLLRVGAFLNMFIAIMFHGQDVPYSPTLYVIICLHLLLYPHLAFLWAKNALDSKRAEFRNLSLDCFLFGALAAALHFPLWITATIYIASTLNLVINHGFTGYFRSQVAFWGGALLSALVFGFHFAPETGWPATIMCLLGNAVYMTGIGIASYKRNLRLREIRETLSLRTMELSTALAQLEKTQDELLESEKLASLGSLVAGMAHELNTPIGNALVTATTLDQESKIMAEQMTAGTVKRSALNTFLNRSSEMSDLIARSCQKAARLITSFKQVAVDQSSEVERQFNLFKVVEDNLATITPSFRHNPIEIRNAVPKTIVCTSFPGALGQIVTGVVHNALTHAFDAGETGRITIEAIADTERVRLTIRDNGKGMSPETAKHVFEPFFTTRLGQGQSGLGLTICRNIAAGVLGGSLRLESQEGEGSVFIIDFPMQKPQAAAPK